MSVYLKLGDLDLSEYIVENEYQATVIPVYDEDSSYVNIYGRTVKSMIGHSVDITSKLYRIDEDTAEALATIMKKESVTTYYSSPDYSEGSFEPKKLFLSLDCDVDGVKYWNAEIELYAELISSESL